MKVLALALAAVLGAHQASATAWWQTKDFFSTPQTCNNVCSDKQRNGFDWADLAEGTFTEYNQFTFTGFNCSTKNGKKGIKHITGTLSKQIGGLQMSRNGNNGFSARSFHVSTTRNVDVVFLYEMPDGSQCRQTVPCKSNGTEVVNNQCGGAVSVSWSIAEHSEVEETKIIFDNIGFDCNPAKPPKFNTGEDTTTASQGSSKTETPPPSWKSLALSDIVGSTGWPKFPSVNTSQPGSSQTIASSTKRPACSPSVVHTTKTITTCAEGQNGDCPADKKTTTTTEIRTTTMPCENRPSETATENNGKGKDKGCPVFPPVWGSSTAATTTSKHAGSDMPKQTTPPAQSSKHTSSSSQTSSSSSQSESSKPAESSTQAAINLPQETNNPTDKPKDNNPGTGVGANCPSVLPKCINTWLPDDCKDNTDLSCYCREEKTTSKIIECVTAWGTDKEVQAALSYFTGLCSDHVKENPGIITDVPNTVTLSPPPPPPPASSQTNTATAPPASEEGGDNLGGDSGSPSSSSSSQKCVTLTVTSSTIIVPDVTFSTTTNSAGETSVDLFEPAPTPDVTTTEDVDGAPPITSSPVDDATETSVGGPPPPGPEITSPVDTSDEEEEEEEEEEDEGENNEPLPTTITTDDTEGGEIETSSTTPDESQETETESETQTTLTTTTSSTESTTSILTDEDVTDIPSPLSPPFSDAATEFTVRRAFLAGVGGILGFVLV